MKVQHEVRHLISPKLFDIKGWFHTFNIGTTTEFYSLQRWCHNKTQMNILIYLKDKQRKDFQTL